MAAGKALDGEPYAGNPHMWIDEGEVAPTATPRRGSLLYKKQTIARSVTALNIVAAIIAATFSSFASPHDGWREAKVAFLGDSITDARHIGCTSNYWNFLERDLGIVPFVYGKNGHQWKNLTGQAEKLKEEHPDCRLILVSLDPISRKSGDTELIYVLDFLKLLWNYQIF